MQINWMTISESFCPVALGATTRKMSRTIPVFMAEEWWLELCSLLLRILWFFNAGASHVLFQWQHLHTLTNQTVNMRTYYDFDIGRSRSMIWYQSVRNVKINHFWRIWLETCDSEHCEDKRVFCGETGQGDSVSMCTGWRISLYI